MLCYRLRDLEQSKYRGSCAFRVMDFQSVPGFSPLATISCGWLLFRQGCLAGGLHKSQAQQAEFLLSLKGLKEPDGVLPRLPDGETDPAWYEKS